MFSFLFQQGLDKALFILHNTYYVITYIGGDMEHPEWVLKHKRKGTELRFIKGTYYLYEVSSKWNREKKRAQKITGKLLGKITPEGFIQSPKLAVTQQPISSVIVKEYGATYFLMESLSDLGDALRKTFPSHWREILVLACLRLLHHSPLKNMDFHFQHSYLSELYPDVSVTDKKAGLLLRTIGNWRQKIVDLFRVRIMETHHDYLLIDATHLLSYSRQMEITEMGYSGSKEFAPQVNLLFIYAAALKMPVYYRIIPGNIREVSAFKLTLLESGINNVIIIADKGFYSASNITELQKEQLHFIIPLRRSSVLIDYEPMKVPEKRGFNGYFKFSNRYVWYYSYPSENGMIHCYLNEQLKHNEEQDYLSRIEKHPEKYSIEYFHNKQSHFGTLAISTNITKATPQDIYTHYKSRNNIEVMFDAMKNILHADRSYMHDETALEGWMFITFIALQWYYHIYQLLADKNLLSKFSPQDVLMHLSKIKKVKINNVWHLSEVPAKSKMLMEKLNIPIT